MNAPYGETECQNKVELHTELEIDPHGEGQWFTQHKKASSYGFEIHLCMKKPTAFFGTRRRRYRQLLSRSMPRDSGEERTSQGRLMLLENALDRRLSNPPSRCRRRSRLRATMGYNNPDVHFILDALFGRMSCDF